MKIIVPMAGMGKRLRPHTLTTPKPLLPIAGKPIVQRLVEDIVSISDQKVEEIAYVVGRFGEAAEKHLITVAESLGAKGTIHYQDEALGTAHAILCAASALNGPVTVAFADTLFKADFKLDTTKDGVLWVQKIDDPRQFGVVIVNEENTITEFKEKPQEFVSDLAMIGIYYFKDGNALKNELQFLIDNNITNGGEYQLPDALRNMVKKGARFAPGKVSDWMDCGNKEAMIDTNTKVLGYISNTLVIPSSASLINATIVPPCFIGENTVIQNAVIGPYVSLGNNARVENAVVSHSILQNESKVTNAVVTNSMIGIGSQVSSAARVLSISDYSNIK